MLNPNYSFGEFSEVEEDSGFEPVPRAIYPFRVVNVELAPTASGGQGVKLALKIRDGEFEGREIYEFFNVVNSNPQAVSIALKGLKALFKATGLDATGSISWGAIQSLEGRLGSALIGLDKKDPTRNKVVRYLAEEQNNANQQSNNPNMEQQQMAPANNAPNQGVNNQPWRQQ